MLQQRAIHTPTRETKKNVRSNNVVHIKNPKNIVIVESPSIFLTFVKFKAFCSRLGFLK
jgi:hypothetical protein